MVWTPRRGPGLFLALGTLVGLLVVLPLVAGNTGSYVPRNDPGVPINRSPGERYAHVSDCVDCHKGAPWHMPDTVVIYPEAPSQLRLGQPYDLPVHIVNPWKHRVQGMSLEVILRGETQVLTVVADSKSRTVLDDQTGQTFAEVGPASNFPITVPGHPPERVEVPIRLEPNGTRFHATVQLLPHQGLPTDPDHYEVKLLWGESGERGAEYSFEPTQGTALERHVAINVTLPGTVRVVVTHVRGYATTTDVYVNYTLIKRPLDASGKSYRVPIPDNATIPKFKPPLIVPVRLVPFQVGVQQLEFRVRAEAYYVHSDRSYPTADNFTRAALLDSEEDVIRRNLLMPRRAIHVGHEFVPSPYAATTSVAIPGTGWQLVAAEMAGFASAGLLVPSLVLGGTYGKTSRRVLNHLMGGAKRRVMYHSLLSMGLSLVALVHILLFLWESAYELTVGILWGGFGALALLVLGLTGYYQVPLIQRHGFGFWRLIHLGSGLAVIVFVGLHTVLDGTDFASVRDQLPTWLRSLNL